MIFKVVGETWRWGGRLILPRAGTLQTQMYQWLMAHPRASLGSKPLVLYTPSCGDGTWGSVPLNHGDMLWMGKRKPRGTFAPYLPLLHLTLKTLSRGADANSRWRRKAHTLSICHMC